MITSRLLQPALIALTVLNLGMLGMNLFHKPADAAPVGRGMLRASGLEIVDSRGRVRASIALHPSARQPDGSRYPETVLLRLITADGRPLVKIASSEDGAALSLGAAQGPAFAQILSREGEPRLVLTNGAGQQTATLP